MQPAKGRQSRLVGGIDRQAKVEASRNLKLHFRREGTSFTETVIEQVWRKGSIPAPGIEHLWRKDACGAWIGRSAYGDRHSDFGWEIDHITPLAAVGSDH